MINKIEKVYNNLKDIEYGWFDKDGQKRTHIHSENYVHEYRFQLPEELSKSRIGCCWEVAGLLKEELLEEGIDAKTYFFAMKIGKCFSHSTTLAELDNKYYWIEISNKDFIGIHEYNSIEEFMEYIINNFYKLMKAEETEINKKNIFIYEYDTPKTKLKCVPFYLHCFKGKNLTKKYNPAFKKDFKN